MYNYQILDTKIRDVDIEPTCLGEYETYEEAYGDFKAMGGLEAGSSLIIDEIRHDDIDG